MATEIVVYHVGGGSDELGPIEKVRENGFPIRVRTFEALDGACLAHEHGQQAFYVNKHSMSSGLYPTNPRYGGETFDSTSMTWAENTALERVEMMTVRSLDSIIDEQIDVLSIDTQGAELAIMMGAEKTLEQVLCVIAEVEFVPIYEGQPLFHQQMAFLIERGFRLVELMNAQQWHQGRKFGLGFLTVAEAVWLREDYENLSPLQVEKLAMLSAGFGRLSYTLKLLEHLGSGNYTNQWLCDLWAWRDDPELRKL